MEIKMKLSQILSTAVALSALTFANLSSAIPITLSVSTSGGYSTSQTTTNGHANFFSTSILGWLIDFNVALAGNAATSPDIFSLNTTATKASIFDPTAPSTDLTITAIATGFTNLGTLGGHFASIGPDNTSAIDYSIDGGTNWLSLASYNTGVGATAMNVVFGAAPLVSYDLRITQFFTAGSSGSVTSVSVSVPEPSIVALLGLGLIGMGVATRRKKKAA